MADQIGDIIKNITDDIKVVVRGEVELAKREITTSAKHAGVGAGMFFVALVFLLWALTLLYFAGAGGFAVLFRNLWGLTALGAFALGCVAMALVLLLLAIILVLIGYLQVRKTSGPKKAIAQASATAEAASNAITVGNAQVEAEVARNKALNTNRA